MTSTAPLTHTTTPMPVVPRYAPIVPAPALHLPVLSPPTSGWVALPPHVWGKDDVCDQCCEARHTQSFDDYVAQWLRDEYEGDPWHTHMDYEEYTYLYASCHGVTTYYMVTLEVALFSPLLPL